MSASARLPQTPGAVRVFAPATVANLGPGFDVLGLALEGPGDIVIARRVPEPGVRIVKQTWSDEAQGAAPPLPIDPAKNTAGVAALATMKRAGIEAGVELEIMKGLPVGAGMGGSAASAAAAAYAVNLLLGSPLRKGELIEPCLEAEAIAAGRHADNVAPAVLGGLLLIRDLDPLDIVRLPIPETLRVAIVTPALALRTEDARAALPSEVPLRAMVRHAANLAALVAAFHSGDLSLLARALDDPIVTPRRAELIRGAKDVMAAARGAGAIGSSISGSGPSIFAFCHSPVLAERVVQAMQQAFQDHGVASRGQISPADCPGVRAL